jgi:hypothetical protein
VTGAPHGNAGKPRVEWPTASATPEPGGWTIFAGVVLLVVGTLTALWGLAAVLNDDVVTVGGRGVIVWDFTAWGWIHLIVGLIMVITGGGCSPCRTGARWLAVFFAAVNAILQIGIITAFPLWSLTIIALDVVVIYQLTERWQRQFPTRTTQRGLG